MKNMNTMKHLAQRIVNLYMTKALVDRNITLQDFVQVCNQSEGVKGHKNLNEHGKFVSRFHNWWVGIADRPLSDMMALMDDFFERENYN